jgi:hypothetical protein
MGISRRNMQRMQGRQNGFPEILVQEYRERKLLHDSRLLSCGQRPSVCQRVDCEPTCSQSIRASNRRPYSGVSNMFFAKMQLKRFAGLPSGIVAQPCADDQ